MSRKHDGYTVQIIWQGELKTAALLNVLHRTGTHPLPQYDDFALLLVDAHPLLVPTCFVFDAQATVLRRKPRPAKSGPASPEPPLIGADGQPIYPSQDQVKLSELAATPCSLADLSPEELAWKEERLGEPQEG